MTKIKFKALLFSLVFFSLSIKCPANLDPQTRINQTTQMVKSLDHLPCYFVENKGQVGKDIKYQLKMRDKSVYFTSKGILYQFYREKNEDNRRDKMLTGITGRKEKIIKVENIWLKFVGANENVKLEGLEESEAKFSYFQGKDPQHWVSGARTYHKILYKNLYPHIDLILYVSQAKIKYEYRVKKGGSVKDIKIKYEGMKRLYLNEKGKLEIETAEGVQRFEQSPCYQIVDGQRVELETTYEIEQDNNINYLSFNAGEYKRDREIIISSVDVVSWASPLVYSTYLGGSEDDYGYGITADESGNVYITGYTESSNFPTTAGVYDTSFNGVYDVFVTKINPDGTSLVYSTYLGGEGNDHGYGIGIDDHGNAFVTGYTESDDFPTTKGAFDRTFNGGDVDGFVTKINPSGTGLDYSTYLGGGDMDYGEAIAVGAEGKVYVTGFTDSDNFPTTAGAYDTSFNGGSGYGDAFVTKLNSVGTSLNYSTYLGGTGNEGGSGIALDGSENAYVTGNTTSDDFPTSTYAYDHSQNGSVDAFITKIKYTGASLTYSTYLGGSDRDFGKGIAVVGSSAYVAGYTESDNFPTTSGAFDTSLGGQFDGFITKIGTKGITLGYSTYLGGNDFDYCYGIDVDGSGRAYITGITESDDFPTTSGAYDTSLGGSNDSFITRLDSSGTGLDYSTYFGGSSSDSGRGIVIDGHGNACVIGDTSSSDFPTTSGAVDTGYNGSNDVFAVKINPEISQPIIMVLVSELYFGATTAGDKTPAQKFRISNKGGGTLDWVVSNEAAWLSCTPGSGAGPGNVNVSVDPSGLLAGLYTDTITVSATDAVNSPQTVTVTLNVHKSNASSIPFGEFATPIDGSTVRSSIPVTGWVLDDIGVDSVKIYRGEGKNLTYIGDAVFVEGARPDVQQAFPDYPMNYKAGWGYMMLTNFLPGGGNGIFKIHAIAVDSEGHQVTLGIKTITVDNANAVKPFGAIDTPTQGGTASGSSFINWGWVLTPSPNRIPTDGSTINVIVDGKNIGHPNYNIYRKDIAQLFPNCTNSDGAAGYFSLDTTAYEEGVHTIQWTATDNAGNTDGIGSRYFSIQNTGNNAALKSTAAMVRRQWLDFGDKLSDIPVDDTHPIFVKKGYQQEDEPQEIYPGEDKTFYINIRELEPLEIKFSREACHISGYHIIGNQLKHLPIGSAVNKKTGTFNWLPGPGFLGYFRLVFIEKDKNGEIKKKFISIKIEPGSSI
jgi:hypothetical protein